MLASQKDLLQENLRLPRYERTGWIGVGLEGTLARSTPSADKGNIGPALAPMLRRVKHWLRSGRTVKIVTERAGDFGDEQLIHLWCQRNGLPPLEITDHVDNQMIALWECRCVGVLHDLGYPVLPRPHGFLQRCWMAMMHVFRYPSRMRAEESLLGDCQVAARRFSADLLRHGWHVRPTLPAMPAPPIRWREEPG